MGNLDILRGPLCDTTDAEAYIVSRTPQKELLAQLAEEAIELAHAALKLRRTHDATNPTPIDRNTAVRAVLEEIADVTLLVDLLGFSEERDEIDTLRTYKRDRWQRRLQGKE